MNNLKFEKVSIVIPCYNEKETIKKIVDNVNNVKLSLSKEIILVDDYSADGTREIIKGFEKDYQNLKIIYNEKNRGKGFSLRRGFSKSTGDIIIIQDADLEYDPSEYSLLITPILNGQADVVFGSRFIGYQPYRFYFFSHFVGNKILTFLSNIFTGLKITDMETCYKVLTGEILKKIELKEERFGFEPEVTARIARLRCRVNEVGITYRSRNYKQGKKITWKDGVRALYIILKYGLFDKK